MNQLLLVILLVISSNVFAFNQTIKNDIVCVNGYQYLYSWLESVENNSKEYLTVVQMYKKSASYKPKQPMKCNDE